MRFAALIFFLSFCAGIIASAEPAARSLTLVVVLHDKRSFQEGPSVRVKEAESGKIAQITLRKAAKIPDAWANFFIIHFSAGDRAAKTLEFFTLKDVKYLTYYRSDNKVQRVDLFHDENSLNAFIAKEEIKISEKKAKRIAGQKKVTISLAPLVSETKAAKTVVPSSIEDVRQQALKQEQAKISLEEEQAKARLAQLEQQRLLSLAQKQFNDKQAADLAARGDVAYEKENYEAAEKLYAESLKIAPDNDAVYYKYGVSLYKTENYLKSLANLSLADVSDSAALEKTIMWA